MKTVIQEIKDKLLNEGFLSEQQKVGIKPFIEAMIEKERGQIIDANDAGYNECIKVAEGKEVFNLNGSAKYYEKKYKP